MPTEQNIDPTGEAKFWAKTVSAILASVDSILGKIGSVFPWFRHWLDRPVILPHTQQHWWHMGKTGDRRPAMQIATYWYVTNRTDRPISILNAYIKKPRRQGMVMTKDTRSAYHGSYPVPPHATTDLNADFWIVPPLRKAGKSITIDVVFVDQYGQKRTIRNVKVPSDARKQVPLTKLQEEAIYKLEHDVERKAAAILKDEITRYKKYGRRHGELGSLHALHQGRQVKQIYGDSWTNTHSGQRQEIVSDIENARILTENGDALVQFYHNLETEADKELAVNSLLSRLNRGKEYYCVGYLILYVLFRIGRLDAALATAQTALRLQPTLLDKLLRRRPREKLFEPHQRHGFGDLMGAMNGLLKFEHPAFSDRELDLVEEFVEDGDEFGDRIREKVNSARSFRLGRSS